MSREEASLEERKQLLRTVSLFQSLNDEEIDKLAPRLKKQKAYKEQEVVEVDDPGEALFLVAEGRFKVVLMGENEREVILSILKDGDFFGEISLLDNKPRSATVISLKKSLLYALSREDFLDFMTSHPHAWYGVIQVLCERLRRAGSIIGDLTLLDVYSRVARFLIDLSQREGTESEDGFLLKKTPSQAEMAAMLGTSRESINRTVSEFVRQGLLEKQGRSLLVTHQLVQKHT